MIEVREVLLLVVLVLDSVVLLNTACNHDKLALKNPTALLPCCKTPLECSQSFEETELEVVIVRVLVEVVEVVLVVVVLVVGSPVDRSYVSHMQVTILYGHQKATASNRTCLGVYWEGSGYAQYGTVFKLQRSQ